MSYFIFPTQECERINGRIFIFEFHFFFSFSSGIHSAENAPIEKWIPNMSTTFIPLLDVVYDLWSYEYRIYFV